MAHPGSIRFNLVLCPKGKRTGHSKLLVLSQQPETVSDLKQVIEDRFNIPVYSQILIFQTNVLENPVSLAFYQLRDQDELLVQYSSEVDVKNLLDRIEGFRDLVNYFESVRTHLQSTSRIKSDLLHEISRQITRSQIMDLNGFCNNTENIHFFINKNGLPLIFNLYSILLEQPWSSVCHIDIQRLEVTVLLYIHHFGISCLDIKVDMQERLFFHQFLSLKNVVKSFLRVTLQPKKCICIENNTRLTVTKEQQIKVAADLILQALISLLTYSQLPECQVDIASNQAVQRQIIGVLLTPSYTSLGAIAAVACIENLSFNPLTHKYLLSSTFITSLLHANDSSFGKDAQFIRMFTTATLARLLANNPISGEDKKLFADLILFIGTSLKRIDINEVHATAMKYGLVYPTAVGHAMKLAYTAQCFSDKECREDIQLLCAEIGILHLQHMLLTEHSQTILIKDGLLGYLVCLPWNMPHGSSAQKRAILLKSQLTGKVKLQPPALCTMAKANIAIRLGLDKVLNAPSSYFAMLYMHNNPVSSQKAIVK